MAIKLTKVQDSFRFPKARFVESPNQNERPAGQAIDLLVIHYISVPANYFAGSAVQRLFLNQITEVDPVGVCELAPLRVSAHFFIRRGGQVLQFVPTDRRAWHAGASSFLGRDVCNDFSIGIELEGSGTCAFTPSQYARLANVVDWLKAKHPLKYCAGHQDIAPLRKQDPGPFFDWVGFIKTSQLSRPQIAQT
jgi:N-acetyl-anhydromuramoyl-L-alanine amidase